MTIEADTHVKRLRYLLETLHYKNSYQVKNDSCFFGEESFSRNAPFTEFFARLNHIKRSPSDLCVFLME